MENKKRIKPFLEYTNEEGTQFFGEGDAVICFTESKRYMGTIVAFSNYKESEDAEPQCSVYLDTSKNNMSRSCEIINISDITYMCNAATGNMVGYPKTNEILDRDKFVEMIVGLGYDKEKAKIMYESIKDMMKLYNIPLSSILSSAIQEIGLCKDGMCQDELIEISDKVMKIMVEVCQSVTDIIKESWRNKIASQDGKQ